MEAKFKKKLKQLFRNKALQQWSDHMSKGGKREGRQKNTMVAIKSLFKRMKKKTKILHSMC